MSHLMPVFADHALALRRHGFAVVPIGRDRKPVVSGFSKWSRPPAESAIVKWAAQHPTHNIAIIPGLSDILVADVDDDDQVAEVESLLGPTPLRVRTNRGMHFYYRDPQERLPGHLRSAGLNVDLKSGNSLVIAPPSIHESGKIYALDAGSDWLSLRDLPTAKTEQLGCLMDRAKQKVGTSHRMMRDGSRKQWLNDVLCRHAASCDTFTELLDVARTENHALEKRGLLPLNDDVVVERAKTVWKDAQDGKVERWIGGEAVARAKGVEIDVLAHLDRHRAPDAFMLLMRLRAAHTVRCRRGETFSITPKAMAEQQTIPLWGPKRYMYARDLLLLAGFLERVVAFTNTRDGRTAAKYLLTPFTGAGAVPVTLGS